MVLLGGVLLERVQSAYVLCPPVTLDREAWGLNQILFVQREKKIEVV